MPLILINRPLLSFQLLEFPWLYHCTSLVTDNFLNKSPYTIFYYKKLSSLSFLLFRNLDVIERVQLKYPKYILNLKKLTPSFMAAVIINFSKVIPAGLSEIGLNSQVYCG